MSLGSPAGSCCSTPWARRRIGRATCRRCGRRWSRWSARCARIASGVRSPIRCACWTASTRRPADHRRRCRRICGFVSMKDRRSTLLPYARRSMPAEWRTSMTIAWCVDWTTTRERRSSSSPMSGLGAQNALLGGGRYDGLSEMHRRPEGSGDRVRHRRRPAGADAAGAGASTSRAWQLLTLRRWASG